MQNHLTAAVNRYPESVKQNLIHPISETDAQIITEVIELFKKMEFTAAVDILQTWKKRSDDDVALDLLDLNTTVTRQQGNQEVDEKGQFKVIERYINICGMRVDLWLVIHFSAFEEEIDGAMKFGIELNSTPDKAKQVPYYANMVFAFDKKEERDSVLETLDRYFAKYKGLFVT